jgi:AAA family ATP:ADP antiporter
MLSSIRRELSQFTLTERLFVCFAMMTGFFIACEYGVTRPASSSLFLTYFSAAHIPYVWLVTVPFNLLIITLYNRYLPRIGPWKMICSVAAIAVVINYSVALFSDRFPSLVFLQFVWKDIYILFMFKQLWSMIHSTISAARAKYLYGLIFGMGTLGSVLGSLIPGFFAVRLGSEQLFFFTLPIYLLMLTGYRNAYKRSSVATQAFTDSIREDKGLAEGFSLIFRSRYLLAILSVVVLMQISVGLMEYQFNAYLEHHILDKDLRTEYVGRLVSIMNLLSGSLQLVGSFLMVHTLGVRNSHLVIPLVLLLNALASAAFPSFALLTASFVLLKGVDYSLFGVIREMLYIPLKLEEKYRAKVVIDVFAYRSSKALVSLSILGLQLFSGTHLLTYVSSASIAVFLFWIGVVWFLLRKHYPQPVH